MEPLTAASVAVVERARDWEKPVAGDIRGRNLVPVAALAQLLRAGKCLFTAVYPNVDSTTNNLRITMLL
jgi:hypothetical protein